MIFRHMLIIFGFIGLCISFPFYLLPFFQHLPWQVTAISLAAYFSLYLLPWSVLLPAIEAMLIAGCLVLAFFIVQHVPFLWAIGFVRYAMMYILIVIGAAIVSFVGFYALSLYDKVYWVSICLKNAEMDLNVILTDAMEHGGRLSRVQERTEWTRTILSQRHLPPTLHIGASLSHPVDDMVAQNEKELQGMNAHWAKASFTAMLLKSLYYGSPSAALARIKAYQRNNKGEPYVSPGIDDLLGYPTGKPVNWRILKLAVWYYKFPKEIYLVRRTPQATIPMENWDAINFLIRQTK